MTCGNPDCNIHEVHVHLIQGNVFLGTEQERQRLVSGLTARMSDEEFELYLKAYDNGPTLVAEAQRARESEAAALILLEEIYRDCACGAWTEEIEKLLTKAGRR